MTTTTTQNGSVESGGICEQALDYAYNELSGEAKAAFERHLPTCARCQAEVESFGRVRGAVRAVMPMVDPPAASASMGSLHAQLMHAAAQRRPAGKVLSFGARVKKVVLHPGFAAAASLVLVAGAVSLMWSHDQLVTPVATQSAPPAQPIGAPVAAAPSEAPTTVTTPAPTTPVEKSLPEAGDKTIAAPEVTAKVGTKQADGPRGGSDAKPAVAAKPQPKADSIAKDFGGKDHRASNEDLKVLQPSLADSQLHGSTTQRLPAAKAPAPKFGGRGDTYQLEMTNGKKLNVTEEKAKESTARSERSNSDDSIGGSAGLGRSQGGEGLTGEQPKPGVGSGTWNGNMRNSNSGKGGLVHLEPQQSQATGKALAATPSPSPPPSTMPSAQPTMPAPASVPAEPAPQAATNRRGYVQQNVTQSALDQNTDGMRRKADELSRASRCNEAEALYRKLEKTTAFRMSAAERLNLAHCKTQIGQFQRAQDEIDSLKVEKRDSNEQLKREQEFLDKSRSRQTVMPQSPYRDAQAAPPAPSVQAESPARTSSPSKKAKKAAEPADSANKAAY